jgi:hypothetical protein
MVPRHGSSHPLQKVSRYEGSCISSYRLDAQSDARGGCAHNGRLLRDDEYSDGAEHSGPVAVGQCTITEDFVTGLGGGSGTLQYQGRTYPFKVVGTVAGPGGGLEKISASGPVYKLANVSDFPGRHTQSTGKAGLSSSGSSDLWLENSAGVIMHLQGTSTGAMLTLGKDEIIIRMAQ